MEKPERKIYVPEELRSGDGESGKSDGTAVRRWSNIERIEVRKEKVRCPYCGYPVNAMKRPGAHCEGIFFKCKNKDCKKEFELKI